MSAYDTNLAAEFYVLSVLHHYGAEATLTLGNKKSVDIVVVRGAGDTVTVDVKGLAGTTRRPVDNFREGRKKHYLALVSFLGRIADCPPTLPEVYIVPAEEVPGLTYSNPGKTRKVIQRARMKRDGAQYLEAWKQFFPARVDA